MISSSGKRSLAGMRGRVLFLLILALRQNCFSLFVSNLFEETSKVELEAMFCKAGKFVDSFIPVDRTTGMKRGFGFVRFKFEPEAMQVINLAIGRSCGGRVLCAQFANREQKQRSYVTIRGKGCRNAWFQPLKKSFA